ncbi:hypothetical protein Gotur_028595 [Gossypium turneri]
MGMDISKQIYSYISELNGLEEKKLTLKIDRGHKQTERRTRVTIYFDAAFDKRSSKSISGLHSGNSGGFKNGNKEMPNYRSRQISYWGTHQRYSQQNEIGFHFIPKAENEYAHILAQEALTKGEGHYLLGAVLSYVRREMEKRRLRQPD